MAEYIGCRKCDSTYCKGCNLKNLETMLRNGKFDCIMNENRCINTDADVAPVVHSYFEHKITSDEENIGICHNCKYPISWFLGITKYCPNCGAKMDKHNEPEN